MKKFQSAALISFGPSSEAAPSTATPLVADYWIGSEKELTPCGPSNQICYNFICSSATKSPARLHLAVHPLALCAAFLRFFLRHRKKIANFGHVFNCGISACWLRALLVYPTRVTAVIQSTWTLSAPQRQQNENVKFQTLRVYKSPGTGCNTKWNMFQNFVKCASAVIEIIPAVEREEEKCKTKETHFAVQLHL